MRKRRHTSGLEWDFSKAGKMDNNVKDKLGRGKGARDGRILLYS